MRLPLLTTTAASLLALSSVADARPVFDLVANRTLAHIEHKGGLFIRAGAPGFPRYGHFGRPIQNWRFNQTEDGKRVALSQTQATLEVPLTAAQAKASSIVFSLKSPVAQSLRVTGQGKASPAAALTAGWQVVRIALPDGAVKEGENKLTLTFAQSGKLAGQKASAAIEWISIGASDDSPSTTELSAAHIALAPGDGVTYFAQIPEHGTLELGPMAASCGVFVRAIPSGARGIETAAQATALDLSSLAGKIVRLSLVAPEGQCKLVTLPHAALHVPGSAATVNTAQRPKNVVFWLTDSTRSDKYKIYNPKTRVETPVMDEFAKRATVFNVGYVQGNESRVSHASIFTGYYPAQHKFIPEKAKLNPSFVTLAEAIRPSGLYTAGFMGNGFIDKFWGFGEGWDLLKNHIHDGGGLKGEDLVKAARGFLKTRSDKPFFLYLGTIDAHVSWRAHEPWLSKYDAPNGAYSGPFVKACLDPQLDQIVAGKLKVTDRDKSRILALYDSDISYNDQQFGELIKTLEASGRMNDTMIVLTADHGEEMYDHGRIGHGQSLREELVHVPYVIYYPPLFPAGKRVEEGVEVVDLLPTIVDALGGKIPSDVQGESLIALAQGATSGYPRPAIASQYELAHTMRLGKWKLWVGGSGDTKLFDAASDAAESKELSSERPIERRFVTDALSLWMAYQSKWKKAKWGVASNHLPAFAADLEK